MNIFPDNFVEFLFLAIQEFGSVFTSLWSLLIFYFYLFMKTTDEHESCKRLCYTKLQSLCDFNGLPFWFCEQYFRSDWVIIGSFG